MVKDKNSFNQYTCLFLRCSGSCRQPLTTLPCTRTGCCQASRVTSFWETGLMGARGWNWSRDTPSSSHLVSWHDLLKCPMEEAEVKEWIICPDSNEWLHGFSLTPVSSFCLNLIGFQAGSMLSTLPRMHLSLGETSCTVSTSQCSSPSTRSKTAPKYESATIEAKQAPTAVVVGVRSVVGDYMTIFCTFSGSFQVPLPLLLRDVLVRPGEVLELPDQTLLSETRAS